MRLSNTCFNRVFSCSYVSQSFHIHSYGCPSELVPCGNHVWSSCAHCSKAVLSFLLYASQPSIWFPQRKKSRETHQEREHRYCSVSFVRRKSLGLHLKGINCSRTGESWDRAHPSPPSKSALHSPFRSSTAEHSLSISSWHKNTQWADSTEISFNNTLYLLTCLFLLFLFP